MNKISFNQAGNNENDEAVCLLPSNEYAMNHVYLINETLLFEPEQRRLCLLAGYPQHPVVLHTPASECLFQLLENSGQVLSQRFLFKNVWEKKGAMVSTNTLYQTIASVRKGLKSAGFGDDIIKTVPRAGFKSIAMVRMGTLEDFVPAATEMTLSESCLNFSPAVENNAIKREPKAFRFYFTARVAYSIAAILFVFSCGVLFFTSHYSESVFADYQHIGLIGECDVWSSWYDIEKSSGLFASLSARYPVQCKAGDIVWMSVNRLQLGITMLVCNQWPENASAQCHTIFYRQQ